MNEKQTRSSVGQDGVWEKENAHGRGASSESGANGGSAKESLAQKEIRLTTEQETRFWSRVDKSAGPDGCWLWTAGKSSTGYGAFKFNWRTWSAHRIAWILANGQIPHDGSHHGICVCHKCDNPPCVNPAHLFLGTMAHNITDCVAKGRNATGDKNGSRARPDKLPRGNANGSRVHPERRPRGEAHGLAKLTVAQVIEIRALYAAGDMSQRKLAVQFGVNQSVIGNIARRETWTHI